MGLLQSVLVRLCTAGLLCVACNAVLGLDERPRRPDDPDVAPSAVEREAAPPDTGDEPEPDVTPPRPIAASLPTAGLVAHYALDGDAKDQAKSPAPGVVHGATPTTDRFGRAGRAMAFDGKSSYIVAPVTKLPIGAAPRTLAVWFRTAATVPEWQTIANWGTDVRLQRCSLSIHGKDVGSGPGLLRFSGQDVDVEGTTTVTDDVWHHGVTTYDGTIVELFIDGELEQRHAWALDTARADLIIGGKVPVMTGEYFVGAIDEVRVYDRRLEAAEVKALFGESP